MEVVDLKIQEPAADGRDQYCITPLDYKALCCLRWNYEDVVKKTSNKCICDREYARIRFMGRTPLEQDCLT